MGVTKTIYGAELGIKPGNSPFLTEELKDVLLRLRGTGDAVLLFEPGEYHFYPQYGTKGRFHISNHAKWEESAAAFWLEGFENFEIDGAGSRFVFHTEILPFYINKSSGIRLKDFSVDYALPAYSEGKIQSISPQKMVVEIDSGKYHWQIKDNCLFFTGENFCRPLHLCLEMDSVHGGPAYGTDDLYFCTPEQKVGLHPVIEKLDADRVCFTLNGEERFYPGSREGNWLVLRHHSRSHPAFYVSDSCDVSLEKITVHYAEGMGMLAERCTNVSLSQFHVLPDEKEPRCFTAAADATHFVNCAGEIRLEGCRFEKQMDDGVNVHGFYSPIARGEGRRKLLLGWGHPEQKGVRMARPGDEIGIMDARVLRPVWKGYLESIVMQEEGALAVLDRALPDSLPEYPVMENLTLCPSVIIRKCEFRKNRARGILLTCKKALVEDCLFETAGAAVYLEGEACSWYESGATDSIILKSNCFLNCSYIPAWGEAPVTVCPKTEGDGQWYFHASIKMINNKFYGFDERILYARQAGQILVKDNRFYRTKDYPGREGVRFDIADCGIFSEEYSMP